MKFSISLVLLLLISCGSGEVRKNRDDIAYQTSGVEQFFLTELPTWSNFSSAGSCYKTSSFTYLDFAKLGLSYNLTYPQLLELQAQYNDRLETYFRSTAARFLKPVEQASLFSNTLEQVRGGARQLQLPAVPEIDIIWLDAFIASGKTDLLVNYAREGKFDQRPPVLFSACYSRQHLAKWISEHNLDQQGFFLLSAEWLTSFDTRLKASPGLGVDLRSLARPKTTFRLITVDDRRPTELIY